MKRCTSGQSTRLDSHRISETLFRLQSNVITASIVIINTTRKFIAGFKTFPSDCVYVIYVMFLMIHNWRISARQIMQVTCQYLILYYNDVSDNNFLDKEFSQLPII